MSASLVSKVVSEALSLSGGRDSYWSNSRDEIVLELIGDWLTQKSTFEARLEDVGYDVSMRSHATGVRPDIERVETLGEWLSQPTGVDLPTFQSGSGMRVETWEDRLIQELESWIDDFSIEVLGDLLDESDTDTIIEARIEIEGNESIAVGCVAIEPCFLDGSGYLGKISRMSPQQFALSVCPSLLKDFPWFREVYMKCGLEKVVKEQGDAIRRQDEDRHL